MFKHFPERVRQACLGLIVGGFLFGVFAGMGFYLMATDTVTDFGKGLSVVLLMIAITGATAGFMLSSRTPMALPFAWVAALAYLMVFPLGTIVGVIVIQGLTSKEMARFLPAKRKSKGKPKRSNIRKRRRKTGNRLQ